MTQSKLFLGLFLIFSFFSCQEEQEGEVVYSETFNIDELEDDPEVDNDFVLKYGDYLKSTIKIYSLEDSNNIDNYSKMNTESNNLNQTIEFEFEYSEGKSKYYLMNNLVKFHDIKDIEKGWELGEASFWSGLLNEKIQQESFTEFKNNNINSIGDYSEYSELPVGDKKVMIILHFKWRKLILHFNHLIELEQKDQLIQEIRNSFEKIKTAYTLSNLIDE